MPDATGIFTTEFAGPFRDRLEGNLDAPLGKQVLDMAQAEREPEIQPYRMADDFGRKAVSLVKHITKFGCVVDHVPVI